MATVTEDLVANHVLVDITGGSTITRVFRVTGLVAAPHGQLIEALRDPGIPDIGDLYPNETLLSAQRHEVRPDGPNAARIVVLYSVANRPRGGTWNQPFPSTNDGQDVKQISSTLREVRTTEDRDSNPMSLTKPASKNFGQDYLSEASTFVPVGTIVFERVETSPPTGRARSLMGHLNNAPLGGGLYATATLLFSGYDAQSVDGGRSWQTVYEFQYQSNGWQHRDTWKDESGRTPADAAEQAWNVLPLASFAGLGLDFTDSQTPI